MPARDESYLRFVVSIVLAVVFLIGTPLIMPSLAGITIGRSILIGVGFALLFLLVAWANYAFYKNDLNREVTKDQRIKELEEENRKLKDN